ncbi:TA system VapC family ribonuclease toxin [Pseudonocardia sp. NPDC046786]|uniref:TA system VapC family ribonuclease toxin n=1 Tax=Pseudonocardia sp. NPDC046786 TaxID=3155471 RepID=UPI0033D22413
MSVTVDANVLLYASDADSPRHEANRYLLDRLAVGPGLVHVFWPVAMAYLRIATHPRIFTRPLDPATALANLEDLVSRPHIRTPGEGDGFWSAFRDTVAGDVVRGNLVPDAHIAALMREHGVATIWTSDRDFRRFRDITVLDPSDV